MALGNERELARKKNEAKKPAGKSSDKDGLTPMQRKERDTAAILAKLKKKQQDAAAVS